jgi:hypothetical protein
MKVFKRSVPVFYDHNKHFNDTVDGVVTDIFQHQSVGTTGYVSARIASPYASKPSRNDAPEVAPASDEDADQIGGVDVSDLGQYERRIFSRLVLGKYRTLVLEGDMGSGKTATLERLAEVLKGSRANLCHLCENCGPIIIKLNFNAGYQDADLKVLQDEFRQDLYVQLRQELHQLFTNADLTSALRLRVTEGKKIGDKTYAAFDLFAQKHQDEVAWLRSHSDSARADLLFDYIDERTAKGTKLLTILMKLIHFTREHLQADPGCFILFFDNIDSVVAEAQYALLTEILAYQETAQAQALVTIRRSNFAAFEHSQAAYAFGAIDHIGPDIKEIIVKRLNYYAKNWNSMELVRKLPTTYRDALKRRLDYLLSTQEDARGAIKRVTSICGSSIRMGLYLSERFFMNSAIPYDEEPRYKDDLVRAVLVGNSESNEISAKDDCIANLLLNKSTGEASLLNVRILQLIAALPDDETNRTVRNFSEMLKAIGGWPKEDIRIALNYLMHMRKPLLWVDGKTKYDKMTIIRHSDDVLYLTDSGYFYLRVLLLDLVYVQEAALSVEWNAAHIPNTVDYSKIVERFEVLRCFLEELVRQDYNQTNDFIPWVAKNRQRISLKPVLFVNRMIASLGRSVLHILLARINESGKHEADDQMKLEALNELRNWRSMINIWLGTEKELLRAPNKKLEQLSKEYRDKVPLRDRV